MEKEFVPYELAVKLKKIGFDEPCLFGFDNCSTPMRCSDLRTNDQKFNGVNYNSSTYTSQPTFSQAFRWFREKYGLKSWIEGTMGGNYIYEIRPHNLADYKEGEVYVYEKYEETELACLDKLIEIFESKEK